MIIFNFLGHFLIGSIVGLSIAHNPLTLLCVIFGSLLPDIDHRKSVLGKYNLFKYWMKHRGHCHSLVGIFFISLPFLIFGIIPYKFIVIGALVHVLSDKLFSWFPRKQYFELKFW